MSKICIYGIIVQLSIFTFAFALSGEAQTKSVNEITVSLNLKSPVTLDVLIESLENSTDFSFSHIKQEFNTTSYKVSLDPREYFLGDLLRSVASQTDLSFHRVNEYIQIRKTEVGVDPVVEVIRINQTVTGRVTDEKGESLPGATVLEKGTPNGTITDVDGHFELEVREDAILLISFVGYKEKEVAVNGLSVINVTMEADLEALNEVVVIGYQTVRKQDLTGAVAQVDVSDSRKVSANSLAESLQGLSPGVTVRNNGNPGNGAAIEIRGVASFLNTGPLYVVDGMIADAGGVLMNSNDIESIQILKDASATAIYGSRAANGVIIITTSKGQSGEMKVNVSAKYGISQMLPTYDVMNAQEFADLKRQAYFNSGYTASNIPEGVGTDDSFVPPYDTDWRDETVQTGYQQDYSVSLSGGDDNSRFMVSGGYYEHEGVIIGNNFNRGSFRVNTESERGRFTFGENFVVNYSQRQNPQGNSGGVYGGNAFYDMVNMLPIIPVRAEEYISDVNPGGWGLGTLDARETYAYNSTAIRNINSYNSDVVKSVGNAFAKFQIADWISYKFNVGLEARFEKDKTVRRDGIWRLTQPPNANFVSQVRGDYTSFLFDHTINFNKFFGKHDLNGVVGYSSQETKSTSNFSSRTGLSTYGDGQYLEEINSATGESSAGGSVGTHYRIQGFLGRVNYTYDERYQLTLTGRYDQDSRFSKDLNSKFFPAIAVGWSLHNEEFFNAPKISQLKLRASYGQLGIVTVGSWDNVGLINNNQRAILGTDQLGYVGANQAQLANADLRWETREIQNVGVNLGMFNNTLDVSAEVYKSVSKDALLNLPLPIYLGNLLGNPAVNSGSIENRGIEFAANYKQQSGPLKWSIGGNFTTIKNTVLSVGRLGTDAEGEAIDYIAAGNTRSTVGRSIGEWFVLQTDGLFQSQPEVDNYVNSEGIIIQPNAKPGDIRFKDLNDDGVINNDDRTYSGSPWPTLQAGMQFSVGYKNFDLNAQFIGIFGNTLYNDVRRSLDNYQQSNFRRGIKPWTAEDPNTDDPRIGIQTGDPGLVDNGRGNSDRWLEDGSYVRLRNIELSYSVPSSILKRIQVSDMRLFVSGQNLFTLTKYTGPDPDVTGAGLLQRGVDNGNWPSDRIYSAGIQFEF